MAPPVTAGQSPVGKRVLVATGFLGVRDLAAPVSSPERLLLAASFLRLPCQFLEQLLRRNASALDNVVRVDDPAFRIGHGNQTLARSRMMPLPRGLRASTG